MSTSIIRGWSPDSLRSDSLWDQWNIDGGLIDVPRFRVREVYFDAELAMGATGLSCSGQDWQLGPYCFGLPAGDLGSYIVVIAYPGSAAMVYIPARLDRDEDGETGGHQVCKKCMEDLTKKICFLYQRQHLARVFIISPACLRRQDDGSYTLRPQSTYTLFQIKRALREAGFEEEQLSVHEYVHQPDRSTEPPRGTVMVIGRGTDDYPHVYLEDIRCVSN